jgi:hypothetical protein
VTFSPAQATACAPRPNKEIDAMNDLDLEVVEVERATRPGCNGSSSTNPRCTCPVLVTDDE